MKSTRHRVAELTTSMGAGVLGMGLGILLVPFLEGIMAPLIFVGAVMHIWGMLDMRQLEKKTGDISRPAWSSALYWICWFLLSALLAYLILK